MQTQHAEPVQLAMRYLEQNQVLEALAMLFPFSRRHPADTEALFWLGVALARNDRNQDACRVLGRTVEIDPRHARAFRNLGHYRVLADDPLGAEPLLRLAHTIDPDVRLARFQLGVILSDLGRQDESRKLFTEAVEAGNDGLLAMTQLMLLERRSGADDFAREWAERILAHEDLDPNALHHVLADAIEAREEDRARRIGKRILETGQVDLLMDLDLLLNVATAFPVEPDRLLRGNEEAVTCPACGRVETISSVRGVIFDEDPLARLATLGSIVAEGRCRECGFYLPDTQQTVVLWPNLSIAVLIDAFPGKELEVGQPKTVSSGSFNEPKNVRPKSGTWLAIPMVCAGGTSVAVLVQELADARQDHLPWIGKFGRAERRAQELSAMLRALVGSAEAPESEIEDSAESPGVPDWMLLERQLLLDSSIPARPWRLDHQCTCGEDLSDSMFGANSRQKYEAAHVNAAAIAGKPFSDPVTGETMLGFNCDACGSLYTWVLGIVPRDDL